MITFIEGATGSGKTYIMSRMLLKEWKLKATIYPNFRLFFPNDNERVNYWTQLSETFHLTKGVIAIDEAQKLFDARRWQSLPMSFAEMLAQHRHHHLDLITASQHLSHVDIRFRSLIHEKYTCQSLLRTPKNDRIYPIFQWIRVIRKIRSYTADTERVTWKRVGRPRWYFISRFWTKKLYETYETVGLSKFICQVEYKLKSGRKEAEWLVNITDRDLINSGKARK